MRNGIASVGDPLIPPAYEQLVEERTPPADAPPQRQEHTFNPRTILGAMNPRNFVRVVAAAAAGAGIGGAAAYGFSQSRSPSGPAAPAGSQVAALRRPPGPINSSLLAAIQAEMAKKSVQGGHQDLDNDRLPGAGGVMPRIWSNLEILDDADPSEIDSPSLFDLLPFKPEPGKTRGTMPRLG